MVKFKTFSGPAIRAKSNALIGLSIVLISLAAHAQDAATLEGIRSMECGSLENHYGPFDYTNPSHFREKLPIVENAHFNRDVETLKTGQSSAWPGSDLNYTLHTFPNHHRALYSMALLSLRYGNGQLAPGVKYGGYCYFDRAIRFKPEDATVRLIFGVYFSMQKKYPEAIEQMKVAVDLDPGNAEAHYNLGLLLEKTGTIEEAVQHAKVAYDLGYPLEGLKNKLRRRGVWEVE